MSHLIQSNLLRDFLLSGNEVHVVNGQLLVVMNSNVVINFDWKHPKMRVLLTEISKLLKINAYKYTSYSTGFYGKRGDQGVTLHFINISTGKSSHAIYNASLKRDRNSKYGNKGDNLPKGQFRISEHHKFYKFWVVSGLNLPPRLSSFHDYMGKLKQFIFTGDTTYKDRMVDKIIPLLNVSSDQIANELGLKLPYNDQATPEQKPYNKHTRNPDNKIEMYTDNIGLQEITTTCNKTHDSSIHDGTNKSKLLVNNLTDKAPVDDNHEEWWESYNNASELL